MKRRKVTRLIGVDFGAKRAGTTVVASYDQHKQVALFGSKKGSDADAFLEATLASLAPTHVCIDAPLSLPAVYRGAKSSDDYFYRACDRELHAMSPLFLGGLTARAMKLAARLRKAGCLVFEVYPSALASLLSIPRAKSSSKESRQRLVRTLLPHLPGIISPAQVSSQHHFDALLALTSAHRIVRGDAQQVGHASEGLIYL